MIIQIICFLKQNDVSLRKYHCQYTITKIHDFLLPQNQFNPVTFLLKCLYQAGKVTGHVFVCQGSEVMYLCVRGIDFAIIRPIVSVSVLTWFINLIFFIFGVSRHFQQYFSYIMATSFSGGRSRSTRREPPTMGKQLVNFITCVCNMVYQIYLLLKCTVPK